MSTGEAVAIGFAAATAVVLIVTLYLLTRVYTLVKRVEAQPKAQKEKVTDAPAEREHNQT